MTYALRSAAEPVCRTVYGYILGFTGDREVLGAERLVLAIEEGGLWQLPGGPVEGDGTPDASDIAPPPHSADPLRFGPLAVHVKIQSGLVLERLSPPFAVNMHPAAGDHFDMSLFYLATARGAPSGGIPITGSTLPKFAPECPAEPAMIRAFLRTGNPLPKTRWWQRWLGK